MPLYPWHGSRYHGSEWVQGRQESREASKIAIVSIDSIMKARTRRESKSKRKIESYQKDKRDILKFVQKLRKVKKDGRWHTAQRKFLPISHQFETQIKHSLWANIGITKCLIQTYPNKVKQSYTQTKSSPNKVIPKHRCLWKDTKSTDKAV